MADLIGSDKPVQWGSNLNHSESSCTHIRLVMESKATHRMPVFLLFEVKA